MSTILEQHIGRSQFSDWFVNNSKMVVYEIFFHIAKVRISCSNPDSKMFFIDNHYKTVYGPVGIFLYLRQGFKMWVHKYVDWNSRETLLTAKRPAGVVPEVNLRNLLHARDKSHKQGNSPWLWNPGQMSPEVQNRDISGSTKMTVLQSIKKWNIFIQNWYLQSNLPLLQFYPNRRQ